MLVKNSVFTKRKKIILISVLATGIYFLVQQFELSIVTQFFLGGVVIYFFSYWALDFDLKGLEFIILPTIPILFYLSMFLIYPVLTLLKVPYLVYPSIMFGMYVILLTLNILNIATVKTIPLSKAAWVSMSLIRFVIAFLVYIYLYWFHFDWTIITVLIFLFTVFLSYPGFYLLIHQMGRGERTRYYVLTVSVLMSQIGFFLSFWEIPFYTTALILSASFYIFTGILESDLKAEWGNSFFWEYGVVVLFSVLLLFLQI